MASCKLQARAMHNIQSLQSLPYMELTITLVPKHPAITRPLVELQLIYFQVGFHLNFNLFCILHKFSATGGLRSARHVEIQRNGRIPRLLLRYARNYSYCVTSLEPAPRWISWISFFKCSYKSAGSFSRPLGCFKCARALPSHFIYASLCYHQLSY